MSRVRVPLPYKDQLEVWGDYTRRQMHEAVVGAKVRTVPIAALLSTQETIGSTMLARYMRGEGKSRKHDPIVVPSADGLATYDGHHRITSAIKRGETRVRVRVAAPAPRPPRQFRDKASTELLLMKPEATTVSYQEHDVEDVAEVIDGIAVVCIDTPLESKAGPWWGYFDDYESILCRFENALRSDEVKAVLLKIDSPGGAAQGLNACVDAMRKCKKKIGKPVIAFADEGAYSAAYALACVADQIYLPKAGGLGSIGVIARIVDWTEANKKDGIRVETITTGNRKADGDPNVPVSKEAIAHLQRRVDQLGDLYFKLVEKTRGIDARSLQADTFYGKDAVKRGLADKVMSLDHLVKRMTTDLDNLVGMGLSSQSQASRTREARTPEARMDLKTLAAALEAAIKDGDAKKIEKATAALDEAIRASKKVVTTETKSTESSSSSGSSEEEEEEGASGESGKVPPASASGSSMSSKSSSSSSEEEEEEEEEKKEAEEEKAVARGAAKSLAHAADSKARRRIVADAIATATKPLRAVVKAAAKATGRKSLGGIAGALAAMPKQREEMATLRKEVGALKNDKLRAKVEAKLDKAQAAGKISKAQRESLSAQGMKDYAWLKGHLATLPKIVRSSAEAFVPRDGTDGAGAPSNKEQQAMLDAATLGMSEAERKAFDEARKATAARTNGTAPRI